MLGTWNAQKERSNPFTLRLICNIAQRVPRNITRLLLWPISLYFFFFAPSARKASYHYLKRVPGYRGHRREIFKHILTFASVILDRVYFLTNKFENFEVNIDAPERLDSILEHGQGAIMLGTHLGSFDAMRCLANRYTQFPLKIMMYHDHNAMITRVLDELNPEIARAVINLADADALLKAKEALEEGYLLGMLGDRILPGEKYTQALLLNDNIRIPDGPFTLALILGVPIIQFYGIYEGGNRYSVHYCLLHEGQKIARDKRKAIIDKMVKNYV